MAFDGRPLGCEPRRRREAGQVTVLVLGVAAVTMAVLIALGHLGRAVVAQARAEAAADAVALAAVNGGGEVARAVASANGVTVIELEVRRGWAQVTVAGDGRRATSTAAFVAEPAASPVAGAAP